MLSLLTSVLFCLSTSTPTVASPLAVAYPAAAAVPASIRYFGEPGNGESAQGAGLDVQLEWKGWQMGGHIGEAGMKIADLDGDGKNEIVIASYLFWYVLERHPDGSYRQKWTSNAYRDPITALGVVDYNKDGHPDVFVYSGTDFRVYDGLTKVELASTSTPYTNPRSLCAGDVDADGEVEFVFLIGNALFIYSISHGLEQKVLIEGADVAIGKIFANGGRGMQIVVVPDYPPLQGYILDGRTRQVIQTYPWGVFGTVVRLADVDGDGCDEIISADNEKVCCVMPNIRRTAVWQKSCVGLYGLDTGDLTGDGKPDVVFSNSNGYLRFLRGYDGFYLKDLFQLAPMIKTKDLPVGDLSGDTTPEIVVLRSANEPHSMYVYDTDSANIEWRSLDCHGPWSMDFGDQDADGTPDIAYSASSYFVTNLYEMDALTKELRLDGLELQPNDWMGTTRMSHANIDTDPQQELFLATSNFYGGLVMCRDGISHSVQFRTNEISGEQVIGMVVIDADGDGLLDIVTSSARVTTGSPGPRVRVYDAISGTLKWASPLLYTGTGNLTYLRVCNVDADPALEIVVGRQGGEVSILDGVTHAVELASADLNVTAMDTLDLNGDGISEIIIGDSAGNITVRDPLTGGQTASLGSFGTQIDGLVVKDIAGSPKPDLTFCQAGALKIAYEDDFNVPQIWQSGYIAPNSGTNDAIKIADVDGDGFDEIFLGAGDLGVQLFQVNR